MDDREFWILIRRGFSILANDPSAGEVQKRGHRMLMEVIERRYEVKVAPERKQPKAKRAENARQTDQVSV